MYRHRVQLPSQVRCTVQDICKVYRVQFQPRCTVEVMYRVYRGYSSRTVSTIQELYSSILFKAQYFYYASVLTVYTYLSPCYSSLILQCIYLLIYLAPSYVYVISSVVDLSTFLSINLTIYLITNLTTFYMGSFLFIYISTYLFIYLSIYLIIYLAIYLSFYLSILQFLYLYIYLFIYRFIYLSRSIYLSSLSIPLST